MRTTTTRYFTRNAEGEIRYLANPLSRLEQVKHKCPLCDKELKNPMLHLRNGCPKLKPVEMRFDAKQTTEFTPYYEEYIHRSYGSSGTGSPHAPHIEYKGDIIEYFGGFFNAPQKGGVHICKYYNRRNEGVYALDVNTNTLSFQGRFIGGIFVRPRAH